MSRILIPVKKGSGLFSCTNYKKKAHTTSIRPEKIMLGAGWA
jgi:hypothetical protein